MPWEIKIHRKVSKQIQKLPKKVQSALLLLLRDLEKNGPRPSGSWRNYSKFKGMKGDKRHCHINSGKPTYVCCWEVVDNEIRMIEVYYAGTHEKAPY